MAPGKAKWNVDNVAVSAGGLGDKEGLPQGNADATEKKTGKINRYERLVRLQYLDELEAAFIH